MNLKEKVALVTGGAQGIGKCIAKTLLEVGMSVVVADIDSEAGKNAIEELTAEGEVGFIYCDVGSEESVKELFKEFNSHYKRLDLLVNNAGIMLNKPISELSYKEWNRVLAVNLGGMFLCSKYAHQKLAESKGSIINISSTRAFMSENNTESYSASKGGVIALTHSLAISLGPDIRVNSISPGWIEVSDWKKPQLKSEPELSKQDHLQHPAGRVGRPGDIAAAVLFLADPANSFITGTNFIIDGGMTRKMIYI